MRLTTLFFAGMVAAAPAQLEERLVNCKAVDVVVKVLKIAPSASKYCSSVLKISTVQTTQTVTATSTASITTTTFTTVTSTGGEGGTVTITAPPTTTTTTSTTTTTTTTFSSSCPAANKRTVEFLEERAVAAPPAIPAGACPAAPIKGFACSLVYSACGCLGLPTPTRTSTVTATALTTNTATATSTNTVFVPTTITTTPTITETATATATATACKALNTCSTPYNCNANEDIRACDNSNSCYCWSSETYGGLCLDINRGSCSNQCASDGTCPDGGYAVTETCCGCVCWPADDTCANPSAARKMFKRRAPELPAGIDMGLITPH